MAAPPPASPPWDADEADGAAAHRLAPHVRLIVDEATQLTWGAEVLVGWAPPEGPAQVVEDLAMLVPDPGVRAAVGARVRVRVLRQLALLEPVSVVRAMRFLFRVSAVELRDAVADDLLDEIRVWGLPAGAVGVLVTDLSGDAEVDAAVTEALAKLRRAGVAVGIELRNVPEDDPLVALGTDLVVLDGRWERTGDLGGALSVREPPMALSTFIARRRSEDR